MKLYYHQAPQGNFGDDLNVWLWSELLGIRFDDDASTQFVGVGTLLNDLIPEEGKKIVMGSGYGYGDAPTIDKNYDIRFVRGPKTAEVLGLPSEYGITDPAMLCTQCIPAPEKKYKFAYIPHVGGARRGDWQTVCDRLGIHYIDVRNESKAVIRDIAATEYVITEAMHGAILADAYRVPWVATCVYDFILSFKWQDWCASLDLNYAPIQLPELWHEERDHGPWPKLKNSVKRTLIAFGVNSKNWTPPPPQRSAPDVYDTLCEKISQIMHNGEFLLSTDEVHQQRLEQLNTALQEFKRDYL